MADKKRHKVTALIVYSTSIFGFYHNDVDDDPANDVEYGPFEQIDPAKDLIVHGDSNPTVEFTDVYLVKFDLLTLMPVAVTQLLFDPDPAVTDTEWRVRIPGGFDVAHYGFRIRSVRRYFDGVGNPLAYQAEQQIPFKT